MNVKKSLYVFLCSVLGALLFLILHQILTFGYLMLLYANYQTFSFGMPFINLIALDYFTLIIVLMLGAWYGIWLGLYWFGMVYENSGHGFVGHMVKNYWPSRGNKYDLKSKVATVQSRLEENLTGLQGVAGEPEKRTIKKRVVRKKAV